MSKRLLIVTPHKSFGELLSSNLDKGEFETVIAHSVNDALEIPSVELAILDADITEIALNDFHQALIGRFPQLGTVIIHSLDQQISIEDNLKNRVILLARPFDLAEMLESINEISRQKFYPDSDNPNDDQRTRAATDSWLTGAGTIQDRLNESVFSPLIREGLLISLDNSFASTLPPGEDPAPVFLETVRANMETNQTSTLVRFVNFSGMDDLLVAKDYPEIGILAVMFDPAVKFTQAIKMLDEMAARIGGNFSSLEFEYLASEKLTEKAPPGQALDEPQTGIKTSTGWIPEVEFESASPVETETFPILYPWNPGFVGHPKEPPDVESSKQTVSADSQKSIPAIDLEIPVDGESGVDTEEDHLMPPLPTDDEDQDPEESTQQIAIQDNSSPENIPIPKNTQGSWVMVSYSFLLISNYPQYRLVDETASLLEEEIRAACHDNGWFLLFLEIHQDYIQLSGQVPETVPPALIIKYFRQRTTKVLLEGFSEFERELIEGDFWASAQLITAGSKPEIV